MLSTVDLERLITVKRREIEKEKMLLGLSPKTVVAYSEECKTESKQDKVTPKVSNVTDIVEDNEGIDRHKQNGHKSREDLEDISPELDRYIRRYLGLPVMLKAGEYSPNNPLIRGERPSGDALLGLGEYERRRNTLRKLRQQQYREYLDQQAKKKQEAKEKAERERRQREEREREEEERERARLERERASPERRRTYNYENVVVGSAGHYVGKVDTGVQVESVTHPLSVAVQTDDTELYRFNCADNKLTEAERELSPRTVLDRGDNYSQCDAKGGSREKVTSELRHTYKPSIFDADAIHMRNLQVEKEAAEKRQFYQQELRNQIKEQQRIREERKAREKMLEIAEMRRLEEQLRMLRVAQETEIGRQVEIDSKMTENATDYEKKRSALQKEIDTEQRALFRNGSKTVTTTNNRNTHTSKSDPVCQRADNAYTEAKNYSQPMSDVNVKSFTIPERSVRKTNAQRPFSINIPETSIFSPNYDVDSYLRRNLNPSKHSLRSRLGEGIDKLHEELNDFDYDFERNYNLKKNDSTFSENKVNRITEKALIHEQPKGRGSREQLPVPVLMGSPKSVINDGDNSEMSDAMKIVDGKWQVPVVQKSILKSQPSEEGKKVSILTQLGSIRRQLQMEQLRLDNISNRSDQ